MGKYINVIGATPMGTSFESKCELIEINGGTKIPRPTKDTQWQEDMVCVVDNGPFAAAGYAYDKREMHDFAYPDGRTKQWYLLKYASKWAD